MTLVFSRAFPRSIAVPATLIAGLLGGIAPSHAAVISFSDSIGMAVTNWDDTFSVSKFDPSLGTLTSVKYTLTGTVLGTASYESMDAAPADITLNLSATITVDTPLGAIFVTVTPLASVTQTAGVFDGTIDFGGTSGGAFPGLTATDTASSTLFSGLGDFIGLGSISLDAAATGNSSASGAGNLVTMFNTEAGAALTIEYTYTSNVPEPASLTLLGAGIMGLGAIKRRRKA